MHPAVFLDRDDTVNINADLPEAAWEGTRPGDLLKPEFVRLLPGSLEALEALKDAGYRLIIITNQSGVAHRGGCLRDIDATNDRLDQLLTVNGRPLIEAFYSAPTHPEGVDPRFSFEHSWRKPGPGMILAAAREQCLDLTRSWMIGDKDRDIQAATAAGVCESRALRIGPGQRFADLPEAAQYILEHTPRPGVKPAQTTSISMRADDPNLLSELSETVLSAARGIAERHGTRLIELDIRNGALEARLATHRLAALGFMAQVRRDTNAWAKKNHGRLIWPTQPDHG